MEITFSDLKQGHYVVTRRFGVNHLWLVLAGPAESRFGQRVGAWEIRVNRAGWAEDVMRERILRKLGPVRGRPIFRGWFGIQRWRFLDLMLGRPRLQGFETRREALDHMRQVDPSFGIPEMMAFCLTRWFPGWLSIIVLVVVGFVLDFVDPRRSFPPL